MLKLNNIRVIFNKGTVNEKLALDGLNFELNKGDFISVIGGNGAGKSTMMNVISGSIQTDEGSIQLGSRDITFLSEHRRASFIGRLFQDPMKGTAPNMSIEENLAMAYGRGKYPSLSIGVRKEMREIFRERLAVFELGLEDRLKTKTKLLSGGQRQALSLVMATIKLPQLLLLDEHTAALDPKTAIKVMEKTKEIVEENKLTTIMITHNLSQAIEYGNKIVMMANGRVLSIIDKTKRKDITRQELMDMYSAESEFPDRVILG